MKLWAKRAIISLTTTNKISRDAILTVKDMAQTFNVVENTIRRAVKNGYLPRPCWLFGGDAWVGGKVVDHFLDRMKEETKISKQVQSKVRALRS